MRLVSQLLRVYAPGSARVIVAPRADIFLSYSSNDRTPAMSIAVALERCGLSVWSDSELHGGAEFATEIEARPATP